MTSWFGAFVLIYTFANKVYINLWWNSISSNHIWVDTIILFLYWQFKCIAIANEYPVFYTQIQCFLISLCPRLGTIIRTALVSFLAHTARNCLVLISPFSVRRFQQFPNPYLTSCLLERWIDGDNSKIKCLQCHSNPWSSVVLGNAFISS